MPGESTLSGGPIADGVSTDLLTLDDLGPSAISSILDRAAALRDGATPATLLAGGGTLGLLFAQPSTRTRTSFAVGAARLGGAHVELDPSTLQLARGETIADTARALGTYLDALVVRLADHQTLAALADGAPVPVVNGLTDRAHPCQALADLLTVREHVGSLEGARVAWVGDGNNVCASMAVGCAMTGADLTVATPAGHGLSADARERAAAAGSSPTTTRDPVDAVAGADVVATDVWTSMHEESGTGGYDGASSRGTAGHDHDAFDGFQVNESLLASAPDAAVLHCLPAHRGVEITSAVLDGDRSLVWRQAEARLHVQLALLERLLAGD